MVWKLEDLPEETLALAANNGLGVPLFLKLVQEAGRFECIGPALLENTLDDVLPKGVSELLRTTVCNTDVRRIKEAAISNKITFVSVLDDEYPKLLKPLPAPPPIIWYRGSLESVHRAAVAIVGARRCTAYGIRQTQHFASMICEAGVGVISGGARGIDGVAHRTAATLGSTNVVVLGSGLDVIYPPEHAALFDHVVEHGGLLLSEFSCTTTPKPAHFPRRNRIVAGLASSVLVVEAANRSGALITARIAVEEHGREAFVIPGRVDDPASRGCLRIAQEGWAQLALEPQIVIEETIEAYARLIRSNCEVLQ
ncbi:MAG: DNA-processing protein DprA [Phycisphaerales bacterium]|nr:DNA-processing protein DprA [Phycisphaerales bacterium]